MANGLQALNEQAGADEQDEAERHLDQHERRSDPRPAAGADDAA